MSDAARTSKLSSLLPAFEAQDKQFARAFAILRQSIDERAFPSCSLAVTHRGRLLAWKALGRFTYDSDSPVVSPETVFDLASVSKVVATTAMAMILHERRQLELEAKVVGFLPTFACADDPRRRSVTIRMLLAHSSGLPSWYKLYEQARTPEQLAVLAERTALTAAPLEREEYSDIGFILLGEILEEIAGEKLDTFCKREIFDPLGMETACYNPSANMRALIPPTMDDREFRHRVIQGEVNDENASVMGGVAGHAGVFANALDVARFAHAMLSGGEPICSRDTLATFTRREARPAGTSRALGWDTPSQPSQSGRYFSPASFGHLGHTGTSLWCDPERQLSVTLLTNRTWPDRSTQQIKRVRPLLHDAVVEALTGRH
ncbi:MAG TPA: serine hydrolase domain-containing protein [Candidatus Acidoferrales bacterium]|nr:serine hydrolase domain-containing protein [Candidatus Acidoferrales bacterium]